MSIYDVESQDVDLKNYSKLRLKAIVGDNVTFKFQIFDYNSPVDLTDFHVEYRAFLPKSGNMYSETDSITKSGNVLTIECDKILTSELGEVVSTIRLWNNVTKQKSTYQIILKVLSTLPNEDKAVNSSLITSLDRLDESINRAIELRLDLQGTIKEGNTLLTNLKTEIINGKQVNTTLESNIQTGNKTNTTLVDTTKLAIINQTELDSRNAKAVINISDEKKENDRADINIPLLNKSNKDAESFKTILEKDITDGTVLDTNLKADIVNGNKLKTDVETLDISANKTKVEVETVINNANNKKTELETVIVNAESKKQEVIIENTKADTKIEAMKSFGDVTQVAKDITELKEDKTSLLLKVGDIEKLGTKDKTSLVNAINENTASLSDVAHKTGTLQTNLNSDQVDGHDAGNASGNIPVSNGTVNVNLNAEMLGGKKISSVMANYSMGVLTIADFIIQQYLASNYIGGYGYSSAATDLPVLTWGHFINFLCVEAPYYQVIAYRANTNEIYIRTLNASTKVWNTGWKQIAITESITPTLLNGWGNYAGFETIKAVKIGNKVTLSGIIASGTSVNACQLPIGFRPSLTVIGMAISNATLLRVDIFTDGTITLATGYNNFYVSLNGISFYV